MKTLIVYDSYFGNTEQIAQAIGKALGSPKHVGICKVDAAKPEQITDVELLIVGSPTRAFKPTKAITTFLSRLPSNSLKGVTVAAFDTRIAVEDVDASLVKALVRLFGYAAKPMAERLKKKGGSLVVPPEGFFVKDTEGPLKDGELQRAVAWAGQFTTP